MSNQDRYLTRTSPIFDSGMGSRLREARKNLGLTQVKFSKRLGITQGYLSKLENGDFTCANIPASKFKAILGVYFDYFLMGEETK